MEYYLFFCLFVFVMCLICAKTTQGYVKVIDLVVAGIFSVVPVLNVLVLLFVTIMIVSSRPLQDLMNSKLF